MTRSILLFFIFLTMGLSLSAQAILRGTVTDDKGQPLAFANVAYDKNGSISGATTDLDGHYSIQLDPGTYVVTFSYTGYTDDKYYDVVVKAGGVTKLDGKLVEGVTVTEVEVKGKRFDAPLIEKDGKDGQTFTTEQIQNLPAKTLSGIIGTVPGVNTIDNGSSGINVKGARSNSTVFYLDDVRIRGPLPPATEIEQLEVMTGGIEAKYGDTGGGIISVISKGPSRDFSGNVEVESSQFLDPYGYNLGYLNLAGPILSKKKDGIKKTVLGFRVSGQYRYRKDDRPSIVPIYVASDDAKKESEANPVFIRNHSQFSTAEEYTSIGKDGESGVDIWKLKYRPDEEEKTLALTSKIDAKITDNLQMTLTGTYNNSKDKFTPFGWRFMNSHNNPTFDDSRVRGIFRIRHRLGKWGGSSKDDEPGLFQNMSYTILASFEQRKTGVQDKRFGENLFQYGHASQIKYSYLPTIGLSPDPIPGADQVPGPGGNVFYIFHSGYAETFESYKPSTYNPGLSAYNVTSSDAITGVNQLSRLNGVATNTTDDIWGQLTKSGSPLYKNANQVYNSYSYGSQSLYSGQANLSFDLHPKKGGVHSINMGVQYEQRSDKNYSIRPQDLWNIAGNAVNNALQSIDTNNIIGQIDTVFNGATVSMAQYAPLLDGSFSDNKLFFKAVRDKFNVPYTEYFNIYDLSPNDLSLDMFAGAEIIGNHEQGFRTLDYYGYDYLGNVVDKNTAFDDFFTSTDKNGNRNYPVAPSQPIYMGGYIQDKFIYDEMIFKVGLRVDRYDANTKVMKDKYSLYEIKGAKDFHDGVQSSKPANIGDDYKVYLNSPTGVAVKAYRNGDQWYYSNGAEAADGSLIFGGEVVNPAYVDGVKPIEIHEKDFNPKKSFKDFSPQWDVSPRLSFSFPISDEANFFAHYDILSQRPTSNTVMTPLDYFNFFNDGGARNNPDLKTQKAIDYAVGFQQKVSKTSSIKLTAFYQEMRNLIQRRTILYVPIAGRYTTFDNIDFSTTKGFTFEYDLRRTGNASLYLTYSLQFVNGTGSDANSSRGLATRGVIRTTSPLNFDQRHTLQAILDYRYKKDEGPRLFGKYIFENAGANLLVSTYSGRPYTAKAIPTLYDGSVTEGSLNGARKPWSYSVGLRVDKDFNLTKEGAKNPLFMNIYFRAENLLNTANIINVYPATGSAYDDGFLTTDLGQGGLETIRNSGQNVESYLNFYKWGLETPGNFVLPRRLYMGIIFDF